MNESLRTKIQEVTEAIDQRNRKSRQRIDRIRRVRESVSIDPDEESEEDAGRPGESAFVGVER